MPAAVPLIGQVALNLAIGVGASILSNALRPQQSRPTISAQTSRGISFEVVVGEQVPVSAVFGLNRARAHLIFAQEYGENNEYAKFVYAMGKGWYHSSEHLLLDETVMTLSGSNSDTHGKVITDKVVEGTPYGWWKTYNGASGQAADAGLIAAAPTRWTPDHTGTGTPYGILTIRQNPDVWGNSLPPLGSVWKGLRQYDWRYDDTMPGGEGDMRWGDPSTWAWSETPAVLKWNYRRGIWINGVRVLGLGFSRYAQDVAYYTAAANLSEEAFDFGQRYAFGRAIGDDESALEVQRQFDRAMCGTSFDRGGADAPLPAQQMVSVMTLQDHHRIYGEPVALDRWGTVSSKRTAYHGQFVDSAENWASRPYPIQVDDTLEALIGGQKLEPFDQPFETVSERAQMRAQTVLRRNSYGATRTESFGPRANVLEVGDVITRPMAEPTWGTMLAEIQRIESLPDRKGKRITWRQWHNSIVPDPEDGFIETPIGAGTGPVSADRTTSVSSFALAPYGRSAGGAVLPYLRATWSPITDRNVEQVVIRLWPAAGTEAADAQTFSADPRLVSFALCGPLAPTTPFVGYAILVRKDSRLCTPTDPETATTGELTAAPTPGTVVVASLGTEMLNRVEGTINQITGRLAEFETQLGDLAQVVAEGETERLQQISGLALRSEAASASVIRLEEVVLGPDGALAQLTESVNVIVSNVLASGYLRFTAQADEMTGTVLVSIGVKATNGEWTAVASQEWGAQVTVDGAESFVRVMADKMDFISTAGVYVATPFAIGTINGEDAAKVTTLYFDNLFSTAEAEAGLPIISQIGETGFIGVTVPE